VGVCGVLVGVPGDGGGWVPVCLAAGCVGGGACSGNGVVGSGGVAGVAGGVSPETLGCVGAQMFFKMTLRDGAVGEGFQGRCRKARGAAQKGGGCVVGGGVGGSVFPREKGLGIEFSTHLPCATSRRSSKKIG